MPILATVITAWEISKKPSSTMNVDLRNCQRSKKTGLERDRSYGNLGNAYQNLGDFKKAIEYHKLSSKNCQRSGSQGWRGKVRMVILASLIITWETSKKPSSTMNVSLKIAKEVGDRAGEGACVCSSWQCLSKPGRLSKKASSTMNII